MVNLCFIEIPTYRRRSSAKPTILNKIINLLKFANRLQELENASLVCAASTTGAPKALVIPHLR